MDWSLFVAGLLSLGTASAMPHAPREPCSTDDRFGVGVLDASLSIATGEGCVRADVVAEPTGVGCQETYGYVAAGPVTVESTSSCRFAVIARS